MHMCSYIALVAQGLALCVIPYHPCMRTCVLLLEWSSPHPSLYFFLQFLFQLYLMSIPAPDEISMEDPLCKSSLGSMVTLDYVTPLTFSGPRKPPLFFGLRLELFTVLPCFHQSVKTGCILQGCMYLFSLLLHCLCSRLPP